MKKLIAILLILTLALGLASCGGGNKSKLVGLWELTDDSAETTYGYGIEFKKDGTMNYGITEDMLSQFSGEDMSEDELDDMMEGLGYLMTIEYKVQSDTEMKITVKAMFGLASESTVVTYSLDGDTLVFDGATYKRAK